MDDERVHVLVAVKDLPAAKTRLAPALGEQHRGALVLAMLTDTVTAALRYPGIATVHVVTRDDAVARAATAAGARTVRDTCTGPDGLNAALRLGAAAVAENEPGARLLALQADLPALRPAELGGALAASAGARALVADAAGAGTTLLLAAAGGRLDPRFGAGSAARHRTSGAAELVGAWPGLRGDVDTLDDLAAALRAGVGSATAALVDATGVPATVQLHDEAGVLLRTDDGRELYGGADSVRRGGWRTLRAGQRLRVHTGVDGSVHLLTAPGARPPG